MRLQTALFSFLIAILTLAPVLRADIVPPGQKGVKVIRKVDLGELAPHVFTVHVVEAGETIEGIVRARYGGAKRTRSVLTLNPEIIPTRMKPGTHLLLPPLKPVVDAAGKRLTAGYHVFYDASPHAGATRVTGDVIGHGYYGFRIVLVSDEKVQEFLKSSEEILGASGRRPSLPTTKAKTGTAEVPDGIWISRVLHVDRYVRRGHPAHTRIGTAQVKKLTNGGIEVTMSEKLLGKDGKVLTRAETGPRRFLPQALVASLSGLGLVALWSRRRRADVVE